jgi:hypothetical protein
MSTKDDTLLWTMADTRLDHSSLGEIEAMRRVLAVARKAILEEAANRIEMRAKNIAADFGECPRSANLLEATEIVRSLNEAKP